MHVEHVLTVYFTLMAAKKKITRTELAERADIDKRTVSRCMDALTLAGVPVYGTPGPNGGFAVSDNCVVNRTTFSDDEKNRIIHCLRAAKPNFTEDNICDKIIDKVNCLIDDKTEYLIDTETFLIDATDWNAPTYAKDTIGTLGRAARKKKVVMLRYIDRHESASMRLFEPYTMVQKGGRWYVYGWCRERKDFRLFKIARIKELRVQEEEFKRRPCNVYEKLQGHPESTDLVRFTIKFGNLIHPEVEEWLGTGAITDTGLYYTATAERYGGNDLIGKLMQFGSSIEILEPLSLRDAVKEECLRMLDVYKN